MASEPLAAELAMARPTRRSKGPARPILQGVGLDAPFFGDKNRAFWVLQTIGWSGYLILRSLTGIANSMSAMFVVHTLLLTATGYSVTLLMASLYRRLIQMRALWTVLISLGTVMLASAAFSSSRMATQPRPIRLLLSRLKTKMIRPRTSSNRK